MKIRFCSCSSRDLLNFGCKCNPQSPRTTSVNIVIGELGFKEAWAIVKYEMGIIDRVKRDKMRVPNDLDGLLRLLWEIESYSVRIHDDIARVLEETWKEKNRPITTLSLDDNF